MLDDERRPVPDGAIGELYIGGPGVARGYLGRPKLSAERFVDIGGSRYYQSGDLARVLDRGLLHYCGRIDKQIKLQGVRIEQGEIEAALLSHHSVSEAAVQIVNGRRAGSDSASKHCTRCGLPSNYPGASYDHDGVCALCKGFADYQERTQRYFRDMGQLHKLLTNPEMARGDYDCLVLFSGGKDSTYTLCQLADMGMRVFAFTLDNGYISDQAKGNISRVVEELRVDHIFASTPAMNAIFADSLQRFSNVCNGCFKTIYTLATKKADELKIPFIVTGLSRGQFFETRLTEELFVDDEFDPDTIDKVVLDARKAYHRADDTVNRLLDGSCFHDDAIFERIQFIDFYRYCPASLEEMYDYLDRRVPWVRPTDTGRSTNCLINDAGIYVHKKERGFHNYAFPYSWDVRVGHKRRDAALAELDDEINEVDVSRMLDEVGYHIDQTVGGERLAAYYVAENAVASTELRDFLAKRLPAAMVPTFFVRLDAMPLTQNGKLNREALPAPGHSAVATAGVHQAPSDEIEIALAEIWKQVLRLGRVGAHDRFIDLGGDSITAIQVSSRAMKAGLALTPAPLLANKSIAELALVVEHSAEQGRVSGEVPLGPGGRWFFEQEFLHPGRWNQSLTVQIPASTDRQTLTEAWQVIQGHHDILRARVGDNGDALIADGDSELLFDVNEFDLASCGLASASLTEPRGDSRELRLTIHHLVVDAISWPVLLTDLSTLLSGGELPRKTSSYQTWVKALVKAASNVDFKPLGSGERTLPMGSTIGKPQTLSRALEPVPTSERRTTLQELVMTAVLLAVREESEGDCVGLELEDCGRKSLVEGTDVSRTIGCFSYRFPLWVNLSPALQPEKGLTAVREAFSQFPHRGASFGLMKYHHSAPHIRTFLAEQSTPQLLFRFLGDSSMLVPPDSGFELVVPLSLDRHEKDFPSDQIEVTAAVECGILKTDWSYRSGVFDGELIARLADKTIHHLRCLEGKEAEPLATDFPAAKLDGGKLDKVAKALGKLK